LTTLPPSCADYHEICEPKLPGTRGACPGLKQGLLTPAKNIATNPQLAIPLHRS